ncbi:MAG: putative modified peptide, partial [Conexibacter sp.]|nr:putative modified peptide [Conexibacter sp.]
MPPGDPAPVARLVERLLKDPVLRARFRRDPVGVSREAGIDALADELGSAPSSMLTLDPRESRSSLAGVLMAAAMEAVGVYELADHAASAQAAVPAAAHAGPT